MESTQKSIHNKRHERSAASRTAILAAAERLFAARGLAGARMDAIAAAARVNKALLYYYFKSKEELYEAIVEDHFREFTRQALETLSSAGSARAVLLRYVSLHFDFISARHRYASLFQQFMLGDGQMPRRFVERYFKPRSEAFGRLLERGVRDGEFRRVDPFHAGVSITALVVFYFSAAPVLQTLGHADAFSDASLKRRKKEVLDLIRFGFFADPESDLP